MINSDTTYVCNSVIGTPSLEEWPTSVHIDLDSFEKLKPMELIDLLPGASSEACSLISVRVCV